MTESEKKYFEEGLIIGLTFNLTVVKDNDNPTTQTAEEIMSNSQNGG